MKNLSGIIFFIVLALSSFCFSACTNSHDDNKMIGMPNPWSECGDNMQAAAKAAGFGFPIELKKADIRAMKNMIEISYPIDESRTVIIRKAMEDGFTIDNHGIADISGDYNNYPVKENIQLYDSVWANIRRDGDKIYVVNFSAETGLYSISCSKGLTIGEVKSIFKMIEKAETEALPINKLP